MSSTNDARSMAVYCDFENVALGVRDARIDRFDIKRVLERLLLKGPILVKKAYCDWSRYGEYKAAMHEAAFELIDIPHVRQSGKNSADIRMVVDALDLCHTNPHVQSFVLITGDSDFSPLVSKLRENAKTAIGVGVKKSTSDLLIANCDEFIFYDDLVRERPPAPAKKAKKTTPAQSSRAPDPEDKKQEALEMVLDTIDALFAERGAEEKIWGSMVKQTLKRQRPSFNESYYGFRSFSRLLEEAEVRGLIDVEEDEKSGGVIIRNVQRAPR